MRTCDIEGCDKKHKGHGYCSAHIQTHRQGKIPQGVVARRTPMAKWGTEEDNGTSYRGAHERVKIARGKASEYMCDCGSPATEWAYMNNDLDEQHEMVEGGLNRPPRLCAYSLNPDNYQPMCHPCHVKFDSLVVTS